MTQLNHGSDNPKEKVLQQFLSYKRHINDNDFSQQVYKKFEKQRQLRRWILGGAFGLSSLISFILQPNLFDSINSFIHSLNTIGNTFDGLTAIGSTGLFLAILLALGVWHHLEHNSGVLDL